MKRTASTNKRSSESFLKFGSTSERLTAGQNRPNAGDSRPPEERYLTTSTGFVHVITMLLLGLCRRITTGIPLRNRLIAYVALIIVGGLLNDFAPDMGPQIIFPKITKNHAFNQYFVKWGWLWTLLLLGPYIHLTSKVVRASQQATGDQSGDSRKSGKSRPRSQSDAGNPVLNIIFTYLTRDSVRLLIATGMWFFSVRFFYFVENYTSTCTSGAHGLSREQCMKHGHRWLQGFDISGHAFLLLFSQFCILDELKTMIGWEPFGNSLNIARQHSKATSGTSLSAADQFDRTAPVIRTYFVALTCLSLLWDFMFFQTCLFYHTMVQKLIAAIWAFILYAVCYKLFFRDPSFALLVRGPINPKDL